MLKTILQDEREGGPRKEKQKTEHDRRRIRKSLRRLQ
jgi:hypothetical protein